MPDKYIGQNRFDIASLVLRFNYTAFMIKQKAFYFGRLKILERKKFKVHFIKQIYYIILNQEKHIIILT